MKLRSKLRSLVFRKQLDAEMTEEMRLHLEMQTERNVAAGLDPTEAYYAAQRLFGGVERHKETARAQRGMLWLEDAWKDLRFAVRMLRKNPAFTLVAVISLAIGIGLNTAVFSIINTIFFQTIRGVPHPERVLFFNDSKVSQPQLEHLIEETSNVARLTAARGLEATIAVGNVERSMRVSLVSANYFSVLGVRPAVGRLFSGPASSASAAVPEVVLNHSFWISQWNGDPAVIGESIRVNGAVLTIVGVTSQNFHGPGPEGPPLWLPMSMASSVHAPGADANAGWFGVFGRLNSGVSLAQAQAGVDLVVNRSPELFGEAVRLRLSVGREDWRGEVSAEKRVEFILVTTVPLVIAGGLLWIACSNVGNLLLARAVQRRKEIAIRIASGASRARVIRMLLAESLVLALSGGIAGLWISTVTVDFVFATLAEYGAFAVQLDARVFVFTAAISVVAALLFGLVPAWQASRADVNDALKGESASPAFRGSTLRSFFLMTQIASSFALLVVAGTFVKSLVAEAYVGERARLIDHLLIAELPELRGGRVEARSRYESVIATLLSAPGVEGATIQENQNPQKRRFGAPNEAEQAIDRRDEVWVKRIDEHHFRTAGGVMLQGSTLPQEAAEVSLKATIVNEAMAKKYWDGAPILDQRLQLDKDRFVVAGVVQDGSADPTMYVRLPLESGAGLSALVRVRGAAEESVALVRGVLRGLAPNEPPPRVEPLRDVAFKTLRQLTQLALYIGAIALTLAAAGIYSSMSFSTSQRTHEIGVRMALGATAGSVMVLVLRGGLKVVSWGCLLGFVGAIVGLRLLFGLLSQSTGFDGVAISGVMVCFAAIAAAACWLPARRAAKVDPMVALRTE